MRISPEAMFRSKYGSFRLKSYEMKPSVTHVAMWIGDIRNDSPLLVRLQSACMTSTALGGIICDCADQLGRALTLIGTEGRGLLIYFDDEGRGLGLYEKVITMTKMNQGADTVTAFTSRGLPPDIRDYADTDLIWKDLQATKLIRLLTNNPAKVEAVKGLGINVVERIPIEIPPTDATLSYLQTKKGKLGHLLTLV